MEQPLIKRSSGSGDRVQIKKELKGMVYNQ